MTKSGEDQVANMESPQHSDNDSTVVNDVNVEIEQMTRRKMSMFIQEDILIFTYDSMCVHAHMHRHTHTHTQFVGFVFLGRYHSDICPTCKQ